MLDLLDFALGVQRMARMNHWSPDTIRAFKSADGATYSDMPAFTPPFIVEDSGA